jgi:hypothetical protein
MLHARTDYNGRIVDLAAPRATMTQAAFGDVTNPIAADEPVVLCRGQDPLAWQVADFWTLLYHSSAGHQDANHPIDCRDPVCVSMTKHARRLREWSEKVGREIATIPDEVLL